MFNERRITASLAILFLGLLMGFMLIRTPDLSGSLPGHLVGILGTLVMGYTLVYPFRKRVLKKKGKQNPLSYHIYAGLAGPTLVILHSGHQYASMNGTLAFLAMVAIVLSGLIGRYLLRNIGRSEKNLRQDAQRMRRELEMKKSQVDRRACTLVLELDDLPELEESGVAPDRREFDRCEEVVVLARAVVDYEYTLQGFSKTKALFGKWRKAHVYLTAFLFAMIAVHVLSTIYYGLRWLP
ncbi:MAG: hypothetical protein K9L59_12305 [Desulfobacterales bacterium]|nr:hypothetical protein [Desulfobacterales bacterium]MCF8080807.1 hypothetical protein [Desulfobacterales bacterium]